MTLANLLADLERRRDDAARMHTTAPVADVLATVVEDLQPFLNGQGAEGVSPAEPERLLAAEDVAARLGVSDRWVYDHAALLSGRHLSRRCLRFPESAIRRYLERRR